VLTAGAGRWRWTLALDAGSWCWILVLDPGAGSWCWMAGFSSWLVGLAAARLTARRYRSSAQVLLLQAVQALDHVRGRENPVDRGLGKDGLFPVSCFLFPGNW
jgi:hypothetical protein